MDAEAGEVMTVLLCRCGDLFVAMIGNGEITLACERCRRDKKLWAGKGNGFRNLRKRHLRTAPESEALRYGEVG